jgi:ATPase family associated with various cellular activities (AAA)
MTTTYSSASQPVSSDSEHHPYMNPNGIRENICSFTYNIHGNQEQKAIDISEMISELHNFPAITQKYYLRAFLYQKLGDYATALAYLSGLAILLDETNKPVPESLNRALLDIKAAYARSLRDQTSETNASPLLEYKIGRNSPSHDSLTGMYMEKRELMHKFVYPTLYPHLYLQEKNNVLLYGSPGVGKSLLARATAQEVWKHTGGRPIHFFNVSAESIRSKWEGGTEKQIAQIFDVADKKAVETNSKSILFFDEVESVAGSRDVREDDRALTTLLQKIDGFTSSPNVMILAATNYPWNLDSAFQRRFEEMIFVDLPDRFARMMLMFDTFINKFVDYKKDNKDRPTIFFRQRVYSIKLAYDDEKTRGFESEESSYNAKISGYVNEKYEKVVKLVGENNCFKKENVINNWTNVCKFLHYISKYMGKNKNVMNFVGLQASVQASTSASVQASSTSASVQASSVSASVQASSASVQTSSAPVQPEPDISDLSLSAFGYSQSDLKKIINEYYSIRSSYIIEFNSYMDKSTVDNQFGGGGNLCACYENSVCQDNENKRGEKKTTPKEKTYEKKFGPSEDVAKLNVVFSEKNYDLYSAIIPEDFLEALNKYTTNVGNDINYLELFSYNLTKTRSHYENLEKSGENLKDFIGRNVDKNIAVSEIKTTVL